MALLVNFIASTLLLVSIICLVIAYIFNKSFFSFSVDQLKLVGWSMFIPSLIAFICVNNKNT